MARFASFHFALLFSHAIVVHAFDTLVLPNVSPEVSSDSCCSIKEACGQSKDIILVRLAVAVHHQHTRHRRRL